MQTIVGWDTLRHKSLADTGARRAKSDLFTSLFVEHTQKVKTGRFKAIITMRVHMQVTAIHTSKRDTHTKYPLRLSRWLRKGLKWQEGSSLEDHC